jgi:hypothetical protein
MALAFSGVRRRSPRSPASFADGLPDDDDDSPKITVARRARFHLGSTKKLN